MLNEDTSQPLPLENVPADISQLAGLYELGNIYLDCRTKFTDDMELKKVIPATAIFLIAGIWVIILNHIVVGWLACGFGFLSLIAIITQRYAPLFYDPHIYLCEQGFIFKPTRKPAQVFRWEHIESVWRKVWTARAMGSSVDLEYLYKVRHQNGYTCRISLRFEYFITIMEIVDAQSAHFLLPPAINAYKNGQTVRFGPLKVNQQGISRKLPRHRVEHLSWLELQGIDTDTEKFIVFVNKEGKRIDWSKRIALIPNVNVFLQLVDYVLTMQ